MTCAWPLRVGISVLAACLGLGGGAPAAAQDSGGGALALAPADVEPALAPIGRGFDRWLAASLARAGHTALPLPAPGAEGLAAATARGDGWALIPRLREDAGRVEVLLRLVTPADGQVRASGRGAGPLETLGAACAEAFAGVARALGVPEDAALPPRLDELAAATRALDLRDRGRLLDAWRAVEGRLAPLASDTRDEIAALARRAGGPKAERARVLAAGGDVVTAWGLVGSAASLELRKRSPDVELLLAAAEIQLARGNGKLARRYIDVALAHAPDSAELQLALGRAALLTEDAGLARRALRRAAELDPELDAPLELLIRLDAGRRERAAHLLEAGARSARRLEPERAREQLAEAARIDPALAPHGALARGELESRLGRPVEALAAYREAVDRGIDAPAAWVGLGRAQRATGDAPGAETSLRRAVELAPRHGPALVELGALLTETERPAEALPLLREARELAPGQARTDLTLARALRLTGANSDAVEVLMGGGSVDDVAALRELARAQQAAGDLDAARASLSRAVGLEPDDPGLREQLAALLDTLGETASAQGERAIAAVMGREQDAPAAGEPGAAQRLDFDAMVASFAERVAAPDQRRMLLLGVREPGDWKTWLRRLSRPFEPDAALVERTLRGAIAARFAYGGGAGGDLSALDVWVDQLFAFERQDSLSAEAIARVSGVLGVDGVFVTRLLAHPADREEIVCDPGTFAVETRMLLGDHPEFVSILAATDCVAGGLAAYRTWNREAVALYAALALFLGFPLLRGWGTILVRIQLPEKTKGFFSIHVTTSSNQVERKTIDKKTGREKIRARGRLDFLRRFERHMAGRETAFRWIPARKAEYTVTVGGPLLDARGEEIIGHFLEEQRVRVRRRRSTQLEFDFRPRECAVEVDVRLDGRAATDARVAVAGDPASLRYARDGRAYLYLGKGDYTVRVGAKDTAAEFRVLIEKLDSAVPLHVDLSDCEAVFRGCAAAVEPFLIGDLASAADALEASGDTAACRRLRAARLEHLGRAGEAAAELEAAGDLDHAAELRAADADHAGSASLYEQAGDLARAAQAHRAAGELAEAARCYEQAYDYGNALECWREVGNDAKELELLEKLGEYTDAAQLARNMGDPDRAIANLQQIDARHPDYAHTCRLIAEIVSERGDHALAVTKFDEALESVGLDGASLDVLESYAGILERAGQLERALAAWEALQRRDVGRSDLTPRIQDLRGRIEAEIEAEASRAASAGPAARGAAARTLETRYELIEEIGRGGMGVVYKARDKRLGRIVALKRLPDNLRDHPSAVELFEREARAAAALNHPNIVTLFDADEEDGTFFITMELLEGRALDDILHRHGRLSARDTARIGVQISAGLQYAHERRIVHRDIKTANLFFTNEQVVKIMDFGIAKSLEEVRRSTTVVGGTPYYMAPEQAKGQGVDHRADLYAFGVTLFQLATGALPFPDGDVGYRHAHEPPPDPREIEASLPEELARLILRLLAKRPDGRPSSAAEVGETLRSLLSQV